MMKLWCRTCERHVEYAFLVWNKDESKKHWIDLICVECQDIQASFEAGSDEIKIEILNNGLI